MTNDVKKVPELRFPEFSGEWEEKMLGDVLTILDGDRGKNYPSGSDFLEYGHTLFLNASNVTKNGFSFTLKQYITEKKSISMGNGKLVKDDVVLTTRGSIGNIGWYNEEIYREIPYARINSGMLILRSNNKDIASFVSQFLMSTKGKRQIDRISFGSAQPQLTKKDIKLYRIDFPQIKEQQKIGEFFSKLDRQIELEEQKLAKLEEQKKGYMQKIFSQELRFKDENGNEYSKWEEVKLQNIANIKKGEQIKKENIDNNGKYYHLNGGTTASNRTNLFNTNPFTISISEGGNSCGFIKMNKEYFFSGGHNYTLLDLSVSNYYLYAYLKYHEKNIMSLRVGSGLPNIQKKDISNYLIKIPSKEEQEKIGIFFLKFDELIDTQRKKIEVLKKQKNGFLQKMFI